MVPDPVPPETPVDAAALIRAMDATRAEINRLEIAAARGEGLPNLASIDRYLSALCVAAGRVTGPRDALAASLELVLDALDRLAVRLRLAGPPPDPPVKRPVRSAGAVAAAYAERGRPTEDE